MTNAITMPREQFDRETNYGVAMAAARAMLSSGIIDRRNYKKIDTMLRRKYRPIIGTLQAEFILERP